MSKRRNRLFAELHITAKEVRDESDRNILVRVDDDGFEFVLSSAGLRLREQGPVLYKSHDQPLSVDPEKGEFFSFVHEKRYLEFPLVGYFGGNIEDDRLQREEAALDGLWLFEVVVFELAVHSHEYLLRVYHYPTPGIWMRG